MNLEGGKISSGQLTFLTAAFIVGTSIIIAPGGNAGRDTWLAVTGGFFISLILLWIYLGFCRRYPEHTLVEINDIILGPALGKIVSIIYIWYCFHAGAMEIRIMGEFTATLMSETPIDIFLIVLVITCAFAVYHGIEVLARCSVVLVIMLLVVKAFNTILLYPLIDLSNLLPILDISPQLFFKSAYAAAAYPFGEILLFMMILPFLNRPQEGPRSLVKGMSIAFLLIVILAIRDTAVIGGMGQFATFPSLSAVRMIDVGDVLTRMDIFVALDLITIGFIKVTFFYYIAVLGLAQILKLRSYRPLVVPMIFITYIFTVSSFKSGVEIPYYAYNIWPLYSIPFEIILPVLTLLIALIRKFPQAKSSKGGG